MHMDVYSTEQSTLYYVLQGNIFCVFVACIGLSITLNINQNEYVAEAGDTAGAVVVIRPQNQMPFPEDDGIIVSPGHGTSIAITQVNNNIESCRVQMPAVINTISGI